MSEMHEPFYFNSSEGSDLSNNDYITFGDYIKNDQSNTLNISGGYTLDTISLGETSANKNNFWKYEEDKTLKAIEEYIASTYHSHYTSDQSGTQTLDLIGSIGDGEPFTRSNAIKYLSRFGKKNGKSKLDILKAIHYCILLYHFAGLHKNTSDRYETF